MVRGTLRLKIVRGILQCILPPLPPIEKCLLIFDTNPRSTKMVDNMAVSHRRLKREFSEKVQGLRDPYPQFTIEVQSF